MSHACQPLPAPANSGGLLADGYDILRGAVDPGFVAEIEADLADRFERTPFCEGGFYGQRTKRFGRLLIRSAGIERLVRHPDILALAETALGPWCERIQLNLTQAIELHPGALAQFPHRDQDMWQGEQGRTEYLVNVMWPLTPFMRENWLSAYDFASDRGGLFLSEYARSADPFGQVGTRSVSVQIVSVVRASERSFQVKWSERVYERGSLVSSSRWTAMLTVAVRTPKSAEALRKNPLGLFVEAIDWSREYEAAEGAAAPSERPPVPAPAPGAPAGERGGIGAPQDIPTTTDQQRIIP